MDTPQAPLSFCNCIFFNFYFCIQNYITYYGTILLDKAMLVQPNDTVGMFQWAVNTDTGSQTTEHQGPRIMSKSATSFHTDTASLNPERQ